MKSINLMYCCYAIGIKSINGPNAAGFAVMNGFLKKIYDYLIKKYQRLSKEMQ